MYNNLEDSISLSEKTSKKLLPIYLEVLSKITVIERLKSNKGGSDQRKDEFNEFESSDIDSKIDIGLSGGDSKKKSKSK